MKKYNVLVLGSGGREHSIVWSLSKEKSVSSIFCAPGNAGTLSQSENLSVDLNDNDQWDEGEDDGGRRCGS